MNRLLRAARPSFRNFEKSNRLVKVSRNFSTAVSENEFSYHTLNINNALMKESEDRSLQSIINDPTSTLQGIGPKSSSSLEAIGIRTIEDLSTYKFYHLSKAIATMAATEEEGKRADGAEMNLNFGLDKKYETCSLKEILDLPAHVLQGLSEEKGKRWKEVGVHTVRDLSQYKYCQWAESIVLMSKFEEA